MTGSAGPIRKKEYKGKGTMRRLISILTAGLLAGGTAVTAVGTASATPRTPLIAGTLFTNVEQAGHSATNAQFRSVKATEFLRNPTQYNGFIPVIKYSMQLRSSGRVLQLYVGAPVNTFTTSYQVCAFLYNASTRTALPGSFCNSLGFYIAGDTVSGSISYDPTSGLAVFQTSSPGLTPFSLTLNVGVGQSFQDARVGTEVGPNPWAPPTSFARPNFMMNIGAYSGVALTSYSGSSAGFYNWWTHHRIDMVPATGGATQATGGTLDPTGTAFTAALLP